VGFDLGPRSGRAQPLVTVSRQPPGTWHQAAGERRGGEEERRRGGEEERRRRRGEERSGVEWSGVEWSVALIATDLHVSFWPVATL
jgi:hypothetical protein